MRMQFVKEYVQFRTYNILCNERKKEGGFFFFRGFLFFLLLSLCPKERIIIRQIRLSAPCKLSRLAQRSGFSRFSIKNPFFLVYVKNFS